MNHTQKSSPQKPKRQPIFPIKTSVPGNGRRIQTPHVTNRRGATLVEFAIVLPLIMLILLGCIDFGRFLYVYTVVTNATAEGAAWGSLTPTTSTRWNDGVISAVLAEPADTLPGLNDAKITVLDFPSSDPSTPGYVTVEVETQYSMTFPGIFTYWSVPTNLLVSRTVAMPHTR